MRILIIHNHYLQPGGEDEVVNAERAMLEKFGQEVILFEGSNGEINSLSIFKKLSFVFKEIYWSSETYGSVKRLIKARKPDLIHIHNTFLRLTPSIYQACYEASVPVVQTLHNYRFLCPIGTFYRQGTICQECLTMGRKQAVIHKCWKNSYFLSFILTKIVKQFYSRHVLENMIDHFIVLSEFSKNIYLQNSFSKDKLSVKPNFLNFDPGKAADSDNYALFVGSFQPYKGILTLLKAWQNLKERYPLKIIGDGLLDKEVSALAKGLNVECLGRKSLKDTVEYMKKALFVIVPSECYENFPRVIIEAFACGKAVLASRLGAMQELVKDNRTGLLFEPQNPRDLADKISFLFANKTLVHDMGEKARGEFLAKYSMEKNYDILMGIYEKVIHSYQKSSLFSKNAGF